MTEDPVSKALRELSASLPKARTDLSEVEKDALIGRVGPRTAGAIVRAKQDFPERRIPFLFSTIDTQDVVDLLANDMAAALTRALSKKKLPP